MAQSTNGNSYIVLVYSFRTELNPSVPVLNVSSNDDSLNIEEIRENIKDNNKSQTKGIDRKLSILGNGHPFISNTYYFRFSWFWIGNFAILTFFLLFLTSIEYGCQ